MCERFVCKAFKMSIFLPVLKYRHSCLCIQIYLKSKYVFYYEIPLMLLKIIQSVMFYIEN